MAGRISNIDKPKRRRLAARGFTVAESLMAATVLMVCVVAVAATLGASSTQVQSLQTSMTASMIGQALMEEITARPFPVSGVTVKPGWKQGQYDRLQYDDVMDYDGYTDTTPLKMLDGTLVDPTPPITYTRAVSFSYMSSAAGPVVLGAAPFGLITVTVTPSLPNGVAVTPVTLSRVVSAAAVTR